MKTKEQILEWLDKQPWKGEFYEEAFNSREFPISYDIQFICTAFDWTNTKAGTHIWTKRNIDFHKWYDSNKKPMSWKEYCAQNPLKEGECYIDDVCCILDVATLGKQRNVDMDANIMSKDLCEAFLAYMKLIQLRNAWVKDYDKISCYCKIAPENDGIMRKSCDYFMYGLSFPTPSMADEFIETFKDLLEVAKPLL